MGSSALSFMQKRLSGAKTNKPMKPAKARPKAQMDFSKTSGGKITK